MYYNYIRYYTADNRRSQGFTKLLNQYILDFNIIYIIYQLMLIGKIVFIQSIPL